MKSRIDTISDLSSDAGKMKARSRTSPTEIGALRQAATLFAQAGRLASKTAKSRKVKPDIRVQLRAFAPYYSYENHRCLSLYHYEKHEIPKATRHFGLALPLLKKHISIVEEELAHASPAVRELLDRTLTYCKLVEVDNTFFSDALIAREAWDDGRFIDALDRYRRMAAKGKELIETSKRVSDPAVERISVGNYVATLANAAAAMAQLHIANATEGKRVASEVVPFPLAFDILRHMLQAYKFGVASADANPEWSQYRDALLAARKGIEKNLKANKNAWPKVLAQFSDEPEFLEIMASVDLELYEELCRRRSGHKSAPEGRGTKNKKKAEAAIRILFLAAYPKGTKRLYLDREARTIEERLQRSKHSAKFRIIQSWAIRVTDLQNAILQHDPHIIHFSGHGSDEGQIILEDHRGRSNPVSGQALQGLFKALQGSLRGVVLNSCFSATTAKSITKYVDFVIGMSDAIGDESAITFAASFYQGLGYGRSVETAFRLGCNQIHLENLDDQELPSLVSKKRIDANEIILTNG